MEISSGINHLTLVEYEKITSVLRRDRELRSLEERRVRQLKQELVLLRKKGALKPGADPSLSCARCVNALGRIINRGATCPLCFKKVCKSCRQYGEDNRWICIFCHKQIELKAVSGEWMHEFTKCSTRRHVLLPAGDQVRKVLCDSYRRVKTAGIAVGEGRNCRKFSWTVAKERLITSEKGHVERKTSSGESLNINVPAKVNNAQSECISEKSTVDENVKTSIIHCDSSNTIVASHSSTSNINQVGSTGADSNISSSATVSPECSRLNPWNGIEPEPTVPVRLPNAVPLGLIMQPECKDSWLPHERQSSDDGHSSMSVRSKSTSSEVEVLDENETPVFLPCKPYSPQRKQQEQKPEPNGNRVSSIDTTDSGVCSPILKHESSENRVAQSSPRSLMRSSLEYDDELEHNGSLTHSVQLRSDSSLSDSAEDCPKPAVVFKKVTLRKERFARKDKSLEERNSTASADMY